jgi:hypothetical protein
MLPALSDFFKDNLADSLKALLRPAGLIPAAVFVLLQVLFILPLLSELNNPVAAAFLSLDSTWQLVVISVLAFMLGYLLSSMSNTILRLATGELWSDSRWIAPMMRGWQESRLATLDKQRASLDEKLKENIPYLLTKDVNHLSVEEVQLIQYRWERTRDFPRAKGYLAATALGNVLNAGTDNVWQRYGMDTTALWPHMENTLTEQKALGERIAGEKSALDFLLNLAFVLCIFAIENMLLHLGLRPWPALIWSLVLLTLAYLVYGGAVAKGIAWCEAIQLAFDEAPLREKLRGSLGLRKFSSKADEYEVWRRISLWLLWGGDNRPDDVFEGQPADDSKQMKVSYEGSSNVKVSLRDTVIDERTSVSPESEMTTVEWKQYVSYIALISAAHSEDNNCECAAEGAYLIVTDPRVPNVDVLPNVQTTSDWQRLGITHSRIPTGNPDRPDDLLWHIERVRHNGTLVLQYKLLKAILFRATTTNLNILSYSIPVDTGGSAFVYTFRVKKVGTGEQASIEVEDIRYPLPGQLANGSFRVVGGVDRIMESDAVEGRSRWDLGRVPEGQVAELRFTIVKEG